MVVRGHRKIKYHTIIKEIYGFKLLYDFVVFQPLVHVYITAIFITMARLQQWWWSSSAGGGSRWWWGGCCLRDKEKKEGNTSMEVDPQLVLVPFPCNLGSRFSVELRHGSSSGGSPVN